MGYQQFTGNFNPQSVAAMIIVDCQPFFIVEDVGFNKFMKCLKPNYELPSKKFKEKMILTIFKSVLHKVQTLVDNANNISFTTDIWANVSNHSFINESHTATNISTLLLGVLIDYNIAKHKVYIMVSDNAANITKGIYTLLGVKIYLVFLHTIQLLIKNSLYQQRIISDTIAQCKSIVSHFSHSSLTCAKVNEL